MQKKQIKKLLHHREPYLMVDEVIEHSPEKICAVKDFAGEFFIKGHFPGVSVVPGAMVQELCTQSAGILISKYHSPISDYDSESAQGYALGVLNKVEYAKFYSIINPTSPVTCKIDLLAEHNGLFKFSGTVWQNKEQKAKLRFNLVNIDDKLLG